MILNKILLLVLLSVLSFVPAAYSAAEKSGPGQVDGILQLAEEELRNEISFDREAAGNTYRFLNALMEKECAGVDIHRIEREIYTEKSEIEWEDPGVRFETGYRINNEEIDGETQSAFAGLSWDLLENGFFENRSRSKRYLYENAVSEVRSKLEANQLNYRCRFEYLSEIFSRYKLERLKKMLASKSLYYEQNRILYFSGRIGADDLLKVESELKKIQLLIKRFELSYNRLSDDDEIADRELPGHFDIDFYAMLNQPKENQAYDLMAGLSQSIIKEKYGRYTDKRLRLYARTGISKERSEENSNSFTFGINFSTPIHRKTRNLYPLEVKRENYLLRKQREKRDHEIVRMGRGYREKLADTVNRLYEIRINGERLRRAIIEHEKEKKATGRNSFEREIQVTRLLNDLLESRYEYLADRENLLKRFLQLLSVADVDWNDRFIMKAEAGPVYTRGRIGKRSLYIWNRGFLEHDNTFLIRVFVAKRISEAIISASEKTDVDKLEDFIRRAASYNISTQLMISENTWVLPDKQKRLMAKLDSLRRYGTGIHLDIEPHVLADYKPHKEKYQAWFLEMIREVKGHLGRKAGLTVSLPVSHPPELVEAIGRYTDKIYVMAYGTKKIKTMERRLASFKKIPPEKLVIALRPDDFTTELELELFIDRLGRDYGYTAFAFHDLRQFFRLGGMFN